VRVRVAANVWRPTVAAVAASLWGWAMVSVAGTGLAGLLLSLVVAEAIYLSGIWLAQPDAARHGARTLRMAVAR
jgi:hypothetical protein